MFLLVFTLFFPLLFLILVPEIAFSSPPTLSLSLPLPLPRGAGQGDRAPVPQAVVKPQVLTHLIEGFVIQEGAEPFPVSPSSLVRLVIHREAECVFRNKVNPAFNIR